ncbi:MAG: tRNA epoxyqueuosine(34) reductase QueG [Chloroflexi bacterium]|nr:tRNA epoxyqueuosine(34) reductase QueG [Chloroflexota bacterium]
MSAQLSRDRLEEVARRHGLDLVAVTDASPLPDAQERIASSVAAGRMGLMGWMGGERPVVATEPRRHRADVRSVIVVAAPYVGADRARWDARPGALRDALAPVLAALPAEPAGRIARYALGTDYHPALRGRLDALAADLRADGVQSGERAYVDDRPLAERALAARAGIGWIGKNTNLLTHARAGSWVFLGALLTSAELEADEPIRTTCGSCTRCLGGCPTGALVAAQTIDARRCISYLTIERPGTLDAWEAAALGDWIFGCDVCQEVCPVNADADDSGPLRVPLLPLIAWLLPLGRRAFDRAVGESALRRAGRHRLLRNAIAALGNAARAGAVSETDLPKARSLLDRASRDAREEVREQASAALASLA